VDRYLSIVVAVAVVAAAARTSSPAAAKTVAGVTGMYDSGKVEQVPGVAELIERHHGPRF
jgi:hypothetical protein